jgi:cytochrome P450
MLNTGVIMSWTIVYLFTNPQYLERVMAEIEDFTSEDTSLLASDQPINPPPTLLADLENPDTFPMLDACVLETLRIRSASIGVFRRNVSREALVVDGVSVPTGAFVLYPLGDAHMASGAWGETNVFTFYPERFIGRDENAKIGDDKSQGDYLGFGAGEALSETDAVNLSNTFPPGAHVCTGRRLARLLIKMSTIYLLSNYDIQVVDNYDSPIAKEPLSDPLFLKLSLPNKGQEVHLKYKKRKTSASL